MSSYICSDIHFNSIEKKLQILFCSSNLKDKLHNPLKLRDVYKPLNHGSGIDNIFDCITEVVDQLRRLNALCVSLQYKRHYDGTLDAEIKDQTARLLKNKSKSKDITTHGLYNAMRCLNYQIELKHLKELRKLTDSERNAMIFLNEIIDQLAALLVANMPEDLTCKWEIE